jgi:chemotaxis protein MotB
MKKKKNQEHMNHERWLLSYSDFMTLLMILFVVLYAMSSVNKSKYQQLSESLKVAMGGGKSIIANQDAVSITEKSKPQVIDYQAQQEQQKLEQLKAQVDKYLEQNGLKSSASTQIDGRGLVVSLSDTLFFDTGKAEIKPEWESKLTDLGKILNQLNNYIRIEGHTDNVPIKNGEFSSNWQLSCARAANVTEFLMQNSSIPPEKLSAVGYGQYRPIADNSTEAGRAKNRRVDIIIVNSKLNSIEKDGTGFKPIGNSPVTNPQN